MKEVLKQLNIKVDVEHEEHTGNVSRYFLKLLPGTTVDKIERKATEIALAAKSYGKPIIRPILHQGVVILELVTSPPSNVSFCSFDLENYQQSILPVILGKTQDNQDLVLDLVDSPHMLVSGTTGSGKSVLLNSIVCSLMESDKNVKIGLVDPKMVEFSNYSDIEQLKYPIIHTPEDTQAVIDDLIDEMNNRFKQMAWDGVSNIKQYRDVKLPYIVLVIDEFSDIVLTSGKQFSDRLCLLAQKARACGIHVVISTQRPSVGIINGAIKANFPTRVSFKVSSMTDSRVVLDRNGAEKLRGRGDGLLISDLHDMVRFQGAFLEKEDVKNTCDKHNINFKTKICRKIKHMLGG